MSFSTFQLRGKNLLFLSVFFLSIVSGSSCVHHSPRQEQVQKQFPEKFMVIGHRGARALAPENTLAGFRLATKYGHGFELDTMLCKTGELVVIHDYSLDRVTNGKGKVKDSSLADIKRLDAGSHFSPEYKGEQIPTLEEVLNEFGGKAVIDIEIKSEESGEPAQKVADAVVDLLAKKKFPARVFVSSFNPMVLERIRETKPEILRGQIYGTFKDSTLAYYKKVALKNLLLNKKAVPDILAPEHLLVDEDYVREYHKLGYKIYPWTVNDPKEMRKLIQAGVDGIITDKPDLLAQILKEFGNN
ncbi:glycerophosphodiester phosphodiesterase family protein [Leptospira inadai serovar Lyme str. 10]|uniref:Glycerophosphodiester phosphodiesterase family protein n=2 Tax=Leptospira inadai serovar Lyme TaxID=293084 RepID=V6HHS0_9LEPT|nr:glycerophosphodiester phosphodiesterase family protein [Leptospira inadai]EQA36045.1 glycerophosphodiester phosphodiesterase family protein [Leptospira inadai serovar Lyme str. 10]PNV76846.1 glycerophosphodiester phosphodiesterase [Leptospira inadai serovar Lyme]